jgi:hypothetical protein
MTTLVTIFPVLFSGTITEIFGVRALFVLMAIGTFTVFIFSAKRGQDLIETHLTN